MNEAEPEVYISCAAEDRRAAGVIRSAIERRGIQCAMTPDGEGDLGLSVSVEAAIVCSKVFVIVYSRHSNGSMALMRELEFAASLEMAILPLRVDNAPASRELEFYLSAYHWMDAMGRRSSDVLDELVTRVEALVAEPRKPTPSGSSERAVRWEPRRDVSSRRRFVLLASAFMVIALGGALYGAGRQLGDEPLRVWRPFPRPIIKLPNGVTMEFVWCPPGRYIKGSTEAHWHGGRETSKSMTISKGFWLGKYEVTQDQWSSVMGIEKDLSNDPRQAIANVTLEECQEFIRKLNAATSGSFRLPTDSEWEYACREGRIATTFYFGNWESRSELDQYAWYRNNSSTPDKQKPRPVGGKSPNGWGLHDMYGNVEEFCLSDPEAYLGYVDIVPDSSQGIDNLYVTLRGGSYLDSEYDCRSGSCRFTSVPESLPYAGIRLCSPELLKPAT